MAQESLADGLLTFEFCSTKDCHDMNSMVVYVKKWFKTIPPKVDQGSVILMDNASKRTLPLGTIIANRSTFPTNNDRHMVVLPLHGSLRHYLLFQHPCIVFPVDPSLYVMVW